MQKIIALAFMLFAATSASTIKQTYQMTETKVGQLQDDIPPEIARMIEIILLLIVAALEFFPSDIETIGKILMAAISLVSGLGAAYVWILENTTCVERVTYAYEILGSVLISIGTILGFQMPLLLALPMLWAIQNYTKNSYVEQVQAICDNPIVRKLFF